MNKTNKIGTKKETRKKTWMGSITVMMAATAVSMILTAMIMSSCTVMDGTTSSAMQAETAAAVSDALTERNYTIGVETAYPRGGRMISLTGIYELKVREDNVVSYLPYFGRAYRTTFGTGSPLDFTGTITGYKQTSDNKGLTRIDFDTRNDNDMLHYRIEVSDDGRATINVTSQYRDGIRFEGDMDIDI